MAEEKGKSKNPLADVQNWEQRIRTETEGIILLSIENYWFFGKIFVHVFHFHFYEAPHKWAESWGDYFKRDEPLEYPDKIKYLEDKIKEFPAHAKSRPKYGTGPAFKELCPDFKRKKMFGQPEE